MQMNHHILAKTTTDSILGKFKSEEWKCQSNIGKDFFKVATTASFPSPDASFYDKDEKFLVSFEFKPPTETKRGILTGVGQSIAYLQESNASYLIAPSRLEDFNLESYLQDLFNTQIYGKLSVGLITYENSNPENVRLITNIANNLTIGNQKTISARQITQSRFWAKHQDLPIPLFHLLLHCYFLKKSNITREDGFKYCWKNYLISPTVLQDLQPKVVYDCSGVPITTLNQDKNILFLEKILKKQEPFEEKIKHIAKAIDSEYIGDNYYNSIRKNFVTFLKHINVIDSDGNLTDDGFKLYHLGLVNGPNSKIFIDYFTRTVLTVGHHLDLLFDLDSIIRENNEKDISECLTIMEDTYETKGLLKRNPNRQANDTNTVDFLKYERLLWKSLGLISIKGSAFTVNWKKITEICSLPD